MKTVSLSRKFFRWILFAATVPTIILTVVYLGSFKSALLQHEIEDLSLIADTKLEQIEGYIDTAIIDSRLLSNSLSTVEAIKVLTPLYKNSAKGTDQFSKIEASFHKYFQSFHDRGYYDIFLVTPKGDVILTLVHEKDFATNIFTGPYRDSGLSHVVKRSIFLMESGTSSFEYYKPSGEAAAFIATPVLVAGQLIGVVVIQIDTSIVQEISVELGDSMKSREVLIGAKKGKTFSFQSPVKFGPQFEVGKEMALHKKTGPLINAMKGVTGITFDTDYRGIETIAASRYIPSLNWGMAVKEDLDEVLLVYDQMVQFSILILTIVLLGVAVLATYLGRSVVSPLKSMTQATRAIADGDMSRKVIAEGFNESLELAESFNRMSEHLIEARNELEQRVEERTRELQLSNISLKEENAARTKVEKSLRESEQDLADAQHMAHIGNWSLNLLTNELKWSDEIYHIFEIDKEKFSATYETFLDVIHPDDREKVNKAYVESVKNKIAYNIKHRLRMTDGRIKHVHEYCSTSYDDAGNAILSTGTVQDITEQVGMEEALRRTQKMDALGQLTGGIAHDFNNMLGIILGYTELLSSMLKDQPKLEQYVHEIHHAGERGAQLTGKLLSYTRQTGSDAVMVNINNLLSDKRDMLEKTLTSRIKLVVNLADDLWPVWLDEGDLENAIVNLSINAMHAIDGNGQLTIQTQNVHLSDLDTQLIEIEAGDYVQLCLTDTGVGMDEATKEKVFEPFFSTKGDQGTGLGLSQVYGFVKRSGGAIKVYSEPGHGTRIVLYFLRYHQTESTNQEEEDTKTGVSGHETILIVDDEPSLLKLTSEILNRQGYHTISTESSKQAMEILKSESVDLLLSDVIMPEIDGYQLAAMIQEKHPKMKIQLASGFSDNRHINMTDKSLHRNLIHKPFQASVLLKKIRDLLDEK